METMLKDRIFECRQELGIDVPELARRAGVTAQSAYQWESGKTKSLSDTTLIDLSDIFGVEPRWLAKEEGPKRALPAMTFPALPGFREVGQPSHLRVPTFMLASALNNVPLEHVHWLINPTDAMSDEIERGAIVFVDASVQQVTVDGIYAHSLFGQASVRRIQIRGNRKYRIMGHKRFQDSIDIGEAELKSLTVGGIVVAHLDVKRV